MNTLSRSLAVVVCSVGPAIAQGEAARAGRVVDAQGRGVAATVHVRTLAQQQLLDVPPIATAADGSFRLPANIGEHFAAFASTGDAVTPLIERRGKGPLGDWRLVLVAPRALHVDGLDAWRVEGPVRAFVLLPLAQAWAWPVPLDGRGAGTLPPLPAGDLMLELRSATDEVLWRERPLRELVPLRVNMPAPVVVQLRIENQAGDALAGVHVRHEQEERDDTRVAPLPVCADRRARRLGVCDAKGTLTVRVPRATNAAGAEALAFDGTLCCEHADHATARVHWSGHGGVSGDGAEDGATVVVTMAAATPFHVTLRDGGKALGGRELVLFARQSTMEPDPEGFRVSLQHWHGAATTDADGLATFGSLPANASELRLVIAPGECVPLLRMSGQELDVGARQRVRARIVDGERRAVPGMRAIAMPSPGDLMLLDAQGCEPRSVTDADGVAEFTLAAGRWWLFVCDADGFAHGMVDADAAADDAQAVEWTRVPFATWRVQVAAGAAPVPGARFEVLGLHWIDGTPIPEPDVLLPMQWLGHQNVVCPKAGSADATGWLTVRYLPSAVSRVRGRIVSPSGATSAELDLDATSMPSRVALK